MDSNCQFICISQENTPAALPEFTMSEDQCVSSIQKISTDYFDEILTSAETTAY